MSLRPFLPFLPPRTLLLSALALGLASAAQAGTHTWDVNEVFSNADGTIQFVELREANGTPGETGVGNGSISSLVQGETHSFGNGAVTGPTTNKYYLIATQGFADLPGAPTPDEILPPEDVPFFAVAGDRVSFVSYDNFDFQLLTVPTNGTDSLNRTYPGNTSGVVAVNSPTNYAGATGSVDADPDPPGPVPLSSPAGIALLLVLLVGVGFVFAHRSRRATART